jgi:hypothetical protein
MMVKSTICRLFGALLLFSAAACAQTGVRNVKLSQEKNLPRPSRILVYDFAVSEREITEYQGIMRQQPSVKDPKERERQLAKEVKDALAEEVVDGLRVLGFTVERVSRGTVATGNDLLVDGQFLTVDEGNPLRRLVIGFGSGTSTLQTHAQVYQGEDAWKVLEFTTHSASGKLPGAAPIWCRCGGSGRSNRGNGCCQCRRLGRQNLQVGCRADGCFEWRPGCALSV